MVRKTSKLKIGMNSSKTEINGFLREQKAEQEKMRLLQKAKNAVERTKDLEKDLRAKKKR